MRTKNATNATHLRHCLMVLATIVTETEHTARLDEAKSSRNSCSYSRPDRLLSNPLGVHGPSPDALKANFMLWTLYCLIAVRCFDPSPRYAHSMQCAFFCQGLGASQRHHADCRISCRVILLEVLHSFGGVQGPSSRLAPA